MATHDEKINLLVERWVKEVSEPAIQMKKSEDISTRELRANLSEVIMRAKYGQVPHVVTHHGRKYAAVVSIDVLNAVQSAKSIIEDFSSLSGLSGEEAQSAFIALVVKNKPDPALVL